MDHASRFTATIIIPCRNAAGTVAAAVRTSLGQTLSPLEVLVVDDASTDSSSDIARAAGAKVLRLDTRCNAGGARNRGIEVARGSVLAFLDADVEIDSHWLEIVAEIFASDPSIVAVGGRIINGRPGLWGDLDHLLNHSVWMAGQARMCAVYPTMAIAYRRNAVGATRFQATNLGEDMFFANAVLAKGGRIRFEPRIRITHKHERLDRARFWQHQIDAGRGFFLTRRALDLPGKILFRCPLLVLLYPHLWMVLKRMLRQRMFVRALTLFPWLVVGETARIVGFFRARRDANALIDAASR